MTDEWANLQEYYRSSPDKHRQGVAVLMRWVGFADHHGKWLIDKAIRRMITPEEYANLVRTYNLDEGYTWDVGIAP